MDGLPFPLVSQPSKSYHITDTSYYHCNIILYNNMCTTFLDTLYVCASILYVISRVYSTLELKCLNNFSSWRCGLGIRGTVVRRMPAGS